MTIVMPRAAAARSLASSPPLSLVTSVSIALGGFREGAAGEDQLVVGRQVVGGAQRADEIEAVVGERGGLDADGEEDARSLGRLAQPPDADAAAEAGTLEPQERDVGLDGVGGHAGGERVRRIDHEVDVVVGHVARQAPGAAEAADAVRGRVGPSRQAEDRRVAERLLELARLGRPAEDQDPHRRSR
jgi:hypothetical protein